MKGVLLILAFLVNVVGCSQGNRLWSSYYGSNDDDESYRVATDSQGNVYMVGYTRSQNGIALNGFQNVNAGMHDAMLIKFDTDGNRLWGTYFGGSSVETGLDIAIDSQDNIYICGHTSSLSGITFNGFQNTYGGGLHDAYLVKFDSNGNRIWATYLWWKWR